jgi:hypothetical protein
MFSDILGGFFAGVWRRVRFCWRLSHTHDLHMLESVGVYGGLYIQLEQRSTSEADAVESERLVSVYLAKHMYIHQELVHLHSALDQIEEEAT